MGKFITAAQEAAQVLQKQYGDQWVNPADGAVLAEEVSLAMTEIL